MASKQRMSLFFLHSIVFLYYRIASRKFCYVNNKSEFRKSKHEMTLISETYQSFSSISSNVKNIISKYYTSKSTQEMTLILNSYFILVIFIIIIFFFQLFRHSRDRVNNHFLFYFFSIIFCFFLFHLKSSSDFIII